MEEVRVVIPGYDWRYTVSNTGRVRWQVELKPQINEKGYARASLHENNKCKKCKIHRLVAQAFVPNPLNKPFINHKDGDRLNNNADNLERVTAQENTDHAIYVLWSKLWRLEYPVWWRHPMAKPINQINKDTNELIKRWDCTADAVKELWIFANQISCCLRKKQFFNTAGWYKWEYAA